MTWQLVIVLNNCTDNSHAIVEQFKYRLPIICTSEPRPGVSYARNKAIELVSGDLVIWIDDDVRVSREWLRGYEQALLQWPDVSVFGGPILPEFEGQTPLWLANTWHLCDSAFASRRVPEEGTPISLDYLPYGANFAVRASVQRQFLFDVRLGRCPADPWRGEEELEVLRAILASGGTGRWIRAALVYHVMPQERQTLAYLREYYEGHGKLSGLRSRHLDSRFSAPVCLRDLCISASLEVRFRALRAFAQPASWIKALERAAFTRGWWIGRYWRNNHKVALKP